MSVELDHSSIPLTAVSATHKEALLKAVKQGNFPMAKQMIDIKPLLCQEIIVDEDKQTLLHILSADTKRDQYLLLEYVLQKYEFVLMPNTQDKSGWTPLHAAAINGNEQAVQTLLLDAKGIDVNIIDNEGNGVLHFLVRTEFQTADNLIQTLKSLDYNLNLQNNRKETALHHAVVRGHYYWAMFLLQEGADPNLPDKKGETALHWAVRSQTGSKELVKLLLSSNAIPILSNPEVPAQKPSKLTDDPEVQRILKPEEDVCLLASVLEELKQTEKEYSKNMRTLVETFVIPVRSNKLLPKEQSSIIFGNAIDLYNVSSSFQGALELCETVVDIANLFISWNEEFQRVYVEYCNNHGNAVKELTRIITDKWEYEQFCEYLEKARERPELKQNKWNLETFLIKPVQRLCQYPLLLSRLKDYTQEQQLLQECFETVNHTVSMVNQNMSFPSIPVSRSNSMDDKPKPDKSPKDLGNLDKYTATLAEKIKEQGIEGVIDKQKKEDKDKVSQVSVVQYSTQLTGTLFKDGKTGWKKTQAQVKDGVMFLRNEKNQLRYMLPLSQCTVDFKIHKNSPCLCVFSELKNLNLKVSSEEEAKTWIYLISKHKQVYDSIISKLLREEDRAVSLFPEASRIVGILPPSELNTIEHNTHEQPQSPMQTQIQNLQNSPPTQQQQTQQQTQTQSTPSSARSSAIGFGENESDVNNNGKQQRPKNGKETGIRGRFKTLNEALRGKKEKKEKEKETVVTDTNNGTENRYLYTSTRPESAQLTQGTQQQIQQTPASNNYLYQSSRKLTSNDPPPYNSNNNTNPSNNRPMSLRMPGEKMHTTPKEPESPYGNFRTLLAQPQNQQEEYAKFTQVRQPLNQAQQQQPSSQQRPPVEYLAALPLREAALGLNNQNNNQNQNQNNTPHYSPPQQQQQQQQNMPPRNPQIKPAPSRGEPMPVSNQQQQSQANEYVRIIPKTNSDGKITVNLLDDSPLEAPNQFQNQNNGTNSLLVSYQSNNNTNNPYQRVVYSNQSIPQISNQSIPQTSPNSDKERRPTTNVQLPQLQQSNSQNQFPPPSGPPPKKDGRIVFASQMPPALPPQQALAKSQQPQSLPPLKSNDNNGGSEYIRIIPSQVQSNSDVISRPTPAPIQPPTQPVVEARGGEYASMQFLMLQMKKEQELAQQQTPYAAFTRRDALPQQQNQPPPPQQPRPNNLNTSLKK